MPKVTSTPAQRKSEASRRVSIPESQWRQSTIPIDRKINKSAALELYRLNKRHLEGLETTTSRKTIAIKGGRKKVDMIWYSEREVERVAWGLRGGPEGFEAHLEKLRSDYKKNHLGKLFKVPTAYDNSPEYSASEVLKEILASSAVANPKEQLIQKASGLEWVFDACAESLIIGTVGGWDEADAFAPRPQLPDVILALEAAVRDLPQYPTRTPCPRERSPAFSALEAVLAEAPQYEDHRGSRDWRVVVKSGYCGPEYVENLYWSDAYFTKVFGALIEIIRAHGVGEEGWAAAQWMVYDTYTETWTGPIEVFKDKDGIYPQKWNARDRASVWLQGHVLSQRDSLFEFADSRAPPIWEEYNSLLPTLNA